MTKTIKFNRTSTVGDGVIIYTGVTIGNHCEIGYKVTIAQDALIRSFSIICNGAVIGARCKIGPFVLIQPNVVIGDDCRVHSHSFLCEGVKLADRVFIGHGVQFTNEKYPEAVRDEPWELKDEDRVFVDEGAVIGTGAVILPGVRIGKNAKVGAGAIVVDSVPDDTTVISPKAVLVEERYGRWGKLYNVLHIP
jgi:UDP-2-acetamido-3-amino-2,3-dideoxy-glucuronate N-acetyltransferase